MSLSIFDLSKIGIGPSSSHTVGPMRATARFTEGLRHEGLLEAIANVKVELYGSLGTTGEGHGSGKAVLLGPEDEQPDTVNTAAILARLDAIRSSDELRLLGEQPIRPVERERLALIHKPLAYHPSGMIFHAFDAVGLQVRSHEYHSVGDGFMVDDEAADLDHIVGDRTPLIFPFRTAWQLLGHCTCEGPSISQSMVENEKAWRPAEGACAGLLHIWQVVQDCTEIGCHNEDIMPGGLKARCRAAALHRQLCQRSEIGLRDALSVLDWVNLYALAVNERDTSGSRVVTMPTNGAAGTVPAVLHYCARFIPEVDDDDVVRFLLTAAAIGIPYKENAPISGAEVDCQGEVEVVCSMAAEALRGVLGGSVQWVENATGIGMEHNLGPTCNPVSGLVQVPRIEHNAMASVRAISAAHMVLRSDDQYSISLNKVIRTMRQTGADMKSKYRETVCDSLAVSIIECWTALLCRRLFFLSRQPIVAPRQTRDWDAAE